MPIRRLVVVAFVCAFAVFARAGQNTPPEGFTALFNGTNLDGWWGATTEDPRGYLDLPADKLAEKKHASQDDIHKHWRIENGELVNDGHGLFLTTNKFYRDFELRLEYKTVAKADSGVYLRGVPQVQIWDYTQEGGKWKLGADKGSGGLWNNPGNWPGKDPLVLADKPFGQWNSLRVIMVGERVTVWLNDKRVVDHARMHNYFGNKSGLPVPAIGPIQLQTHGRQIRWRDVFIREIQPDEADAYLNQVAGDGFVSIFNGKDFTGWAGAKVNYQVTPEGTIMCQPNKGGTLYYNKTLGDFETHLEFKLPPGGNNGLAIRYPGTGDTAYLGMCEIQVLDDTDAKYATLHPAQYCGSIYSMFAPHRGYLRPVGDWNYYHVTVVGHKITIELNGTLINEGDAEHIDSGQLHYPIERFKGRLRTEGFFGFAGHHDPVQFRNVYIKELGKN